jgi:adenosine kinase
MEGRLAIPGGSAMNSARAANWWLKNKQNDKKVSYFGCIGKDNKGETLSKSLEDEGVQSNFHVDAETPTGTCAVVVVNKDRALCANLAAACKYNIDHLEANIAQLESAKIIYSTGFFITSSVPSLMRVAKYAHENDKPFAFNLSAVFLIQFELANVQAALEYADYVFANEDEVSAYGKVLDMEGASR